MVLTTKSYDQLLNDRAEKQLGSNETVLARLQGREARSLRNAMLFATNQRVFMFVLKIIAFDTYSLPYRQIFSVHHDHRVLNETIRIVGGSSQLLLRFPEGDVNKFLEIVNSMVSEDS